MPYKTTLLRAIASAVDARGNCIRDTTCGRSPHLIPWIEKHAERAYALCADHMPRGAGFDTGTAIDLAKSAPDRLEFVAAFHHMNDAGFYDCWTEHRIIVRPSLAHGFTVRVTGPDRNGIKDYIADAMRDALTSRVQR